MENGKVVKSTILSQLPIGKDTDFGTVADRISEFAGKWNVSSSMIAYQLYRRGVIDEGTWHRLQGFFRDLWFQQRSREQARTHGKKGGPSYYTLRRHRVGPGLISLVKRMMANGALTTTKAGRVLGVKAKNVQGVIEA